LARSGALVLPWFVLAAAFAAFFIVTANIGVDVLYTVLDPRVRHG